MVQGRLGVQHSRFLKVWVSSAKSWKSHQIKPLQLRFSGFLRSTLETFTFFFTLQAILFYIPRWLWKNWEAGKIQALMMDLDLGIISEAEKRSKKKLLLDYLYAILKNHNFWAYRYFFCEMLALCNVIGTYTKVMNRGLLLRIFCYVLILYQDFCLEKERRVILDIFTLFFFVSKSPAFFDHSLTNINYLEEVATSFLELPLHPKKIR